MTWVMPLFCGFIALALFAVCCALLRQLNLERDERREMMERYRELALRVRWAQLKAEENIDPIHYAGMEERLFEEEYAGQQSTTEEVEGRL